MGAAEHASAQVQESAYNNYRPPTQRVLDLHARCKAVVASLASQVSLGENHGIRWRLRQVESVRSSEIQ